MDGLDYDQLVDMWGLGCVFYELLIGWSFIGEYREKESVCREDIRRKLDKKIVSKKRIGKLAYDLISKLLCYRDKRITAEEALEHPYFSDIERSYVIMPKPACVRARISTPVIKMVDYYQIKYVFPNLVWGLAIHLLQQISARKGSVSKKSTIRAAVGLAAKYYGFQGFEKASQELKIFLLLGESVCTKTPWSLLTRYDDRETVRLLRYIEHTEHSIKSPKQKLALCRSRDPAFYKK